MKNLLILIFSLILMGCSSNDENRYEFHNAGGSAPVVFDTHTGEVYYVRPFEGYFKVKGSIENTKTFERNDMN